MRELLPADCSAENTPVVKAPQKYPCAAAAADPPATPAAPNPAAPKHED